jgi:hypothetical protein
MSKPYSLCVCGLWIGRRLVPGLLVGGGEDVVRGGEDVVRGAINNGQVCVELNDSRGLDKTRSCCM